MSKVLVHLMLEAINKIQKFIHNISSFTPLWPLLNGLQSHVDLFIHLNLIILLAKTLSQLETNCAIKVALHMTIFLLIKDIIPQSVPKTIIDVFFLGLPICRNGLLENSNYTSIYTGVEYCTYFLKGLFG